MKFFDLKLFISFILLNSSFALAHQAGHGPAVNRIGKYGEFYSSIIDTKDADLGTKAEQKFIGEFKSAKAQQYSLTILDKKFAQINDEFVFPMNLKVIEIPKDKDKNKNKKAIVREIIAREKPLFFDISLPLDELTAFEVIFKIGATKFVTSLKSDQLLALR